MLDKQQISLSFKRLLHFAMPFPSLPGCVWLARDWPGSVQAHSQAVASFSQVLLPLPWPVIYGERVAGRQHQMTCQLN